MGSLLCAYLLFDTHIVTTPYGRVLVQRPPRGGTWEMNAALQLFIVIFFINIFYLLKGVMHHSFANDCKQFTKINFNINIFWVCWSWVSLFGTVAAWFIERERCLKERETKQYRYEVSNASVKNN